MPTARILDVLNTARNAFRRLAVVCGLIIAFAAAPLHAQLAYQNLYDFDCSVSGCFPYDFGYLTQGPDGYLYGTTNGGKGLDPNTQGTVFKVSPDGSTYTTLWQFNGTNGEFPDGGLTLAHDGNFYGATILGGTVGDGTLFRITPSGILTVLHNFNGADGLGPQVPPVEAKDNNLYGVTSSGSTYRVTLPKGTFKQLPNNAPGETFGTFLLASDGNLYGTTQNGGKSDMGTVFRMTTAGAIKVIYSFGGLDGAAPEGPLIQPGADGTLYGTTSSGGANNTGVVFSLTLSGTLTVLHSFDPFVGGFTCNNDGGSPAPGLLAAPDGYLYGVASAGGANCKGTIFRISPVGAFHKLFDFEECDTCTNPILGDIPYTTLVYHTNGSFYGLTSQGGTLNGKTNPMGNFYRLSPETLIEILRVAGPIFVKPGDPVQILGNDLTHTFQVTFGPVPGQFQIGSDTYLLAQVPSAAVDGFITVTLVTGQQIETQMSMHILPVITNLDPTSGRVGTQVGIVGGGFVGANEVTFGGVKAASFTVVSPTLIQAIVPVGAKTGKVKVITPNGTATSKAKFTIN